MKSESKSIITSMVWISKGFARNMTTRHEPTSQELESIKVAGNAALQKANEEDAMADYDQEENLPEFSGELGAMKSNQNEGQSSEDEEDYVDIQEINSEDDEEEKEDYTIRKSDSLLAVGTTEHGEYSNIEVYIYDEETSSLYVHHEVMLSSMPLALEWLSIDPTSQGSQKSNYAVLGSFLPQIQLWNLDVTDAIEPAARLGANQSDCHQQGGVLSLGLNPFAKHILASGGADSTVKLWDIGEGKCSASLDTLHSGKVQTVLWSPISESALLTAGFDGKIKVRDVKANVGVTISAPSDVEDACFHPTSKFNIAASFEDGSVQYYDLRKTEKGPLLEIAPSSSKNTTTGLTFCRGYDSALATCNKDGRVRIYDLRDMKATEVANKKMGVGELYTVKSGTDLDKTIACGGSGGQLAIWDLESSSEVVHQFGKA